MEVRPIDANALLTGIEELKRSPWYTECISNTERLIKKEAVEIVCDLCIRNAPTLDYEPVEHGKWGRTEIIGYDGLHAVYGAKCSECGAYSEENRRLFCSNCGAKMDGGKNDAAQHE